MEEQSRRPDQILVCDAGSTDGTWELLTSYAKNGSIPLIALEERRCRPARGRNLAVSFASHEILAVTDIGCDWDSEWFEELVEPFESNPGLEAVMGSWKVRWEDQQTPWAKADYVLQNGLELRAVRSSHSANRAIAYRKDFYLRIGGLPEDLTFVADDMVLALLIQKHGVRISSAPEPRCYWFRPQSLKSLLKEARRNFHGNGEAGIGLKHLVLVGGRLFVEAAMLLSLLIALVVNLKVSTTVVLASICCLLVILRTVTWFRKANRFRAPGREVSFFHLAVLDYLSRWYALQGYLRGLIVGFAQCRQCRARLREARISWS
jgi:cellulose synthase/poly-beta-1,6-N-acetylglucosamine synthase-like glycosyltransferase